jgi:hypothetical protein
MRVDEAGCQAETAAVDLLGAGGRVTDCTDPTVPTCDVGHPTLGARPVDHGGTAYHQIVIGHRCRPSDARGINRALS